MENTQQQKTPEQWFQMLKEPYRSEAITNLVDNRPVLSLNSALECQNAWKLTQQGFEYWNKIAVSIKAGETTYLEPEKLKPEQMESGKWYVIETRFRFLSKFKELFENKILEYKGYSYHGDRINGDIPLAYLDDIKSIRPATKDEVLKYFPDEVFEPIELRPEEPADWKGMYHDLKAKYDQLQPKGEKVYFYFDYLDNLIKTTDFEFALHESSEDSPIYKGVFMGKKKSVLVSE